LINVNTPFKQYPKETNAKIELDLYDIRLDQHPFDDKKDLMNRKKKLIQLHKNKLRNPEKRLQNSKKDKYISKAEREKLALEADNTTQNK